VSVWTEATSGIIEHFPGWPNPFNCGIKKLTSWQCGQYVEIDAWLVAGCIGKWWWSNFVPTFNELTRKLVSGSYKCGFYAGTKAKSPLDIIWEDGSASRVTGEILGPFATGLFYMWAAQTAYDALSMWTSLLYAEDAGKITDHSILIPAGKGDIRFDSSTGSIPLPPALCAEDLIHPGATAFITSNEILPYKTRMFGTIDALGSDHINVHGEIRAQPSGELVASMDELDVRFGEVRPWSMESEYPVTGRGLAHQFWWTQHVLSPLFPSAITVNRWLASQYPTQPEYPSFGKPICWPGEMPATPWQRAEI
jgi:hypothetical protein